MSVLRVKKGPRPYVILDKGFIDSPHLSWKAKGLLAYLLARPDNWQVIESDLVSHAKDGRDAVRSALRELKVCGYITKTQLRGGKGKFGGVDYDVHEKPVSPSDSHYILISDYPSTENPSTVKTSPHNSPFRDDVGVDFGEYDERKKRIS